MIFNRIIEKQLLEWKIRSTRKPLIIRGARQVGKTTLIQDFAKTYSNVISLNLEKEKDKNYFKLFDNVKDIVEVLFLENNISSTEISNTLLFIDEIQESPKAIELLRYFFEEIPKLHVICAGSLLEFAIKNIKSFPVGRVTFLYLHPLNFQEYLLATDRKLLLDEINKVPIKTSAHLALLQSFHRYAIIGGMPEIVKTDIALKHLSDLSTIYEDIWETYKNDVEKYTSSETERKVIKHLMDSAPLFVDKRITFQGFGNSNYKSREVGEAFKMLEAAKIIRLIYPTTDLISPLKADLKKKAKLQFLDTGIINYILGIQSELIALKDLNESFKGAIIPHLVTQELISLQNIGSHKPIFWVREKTQSSAEVDLLFTYQKWVIPIEIKSGKTGTLKSLHQFIEASNHPYAIRMYAGPFKVEKTVTPNKKPYLLMNLPYFLSTKLPEYAAWFIENYKMEN